VIISHSHRFIFVHVSKAGGTSMELALAPHLAWNDLILGTTDIGQAIKRPYEREFGLSEHASVEEIAAVCGSELFRGYFSFALVRHPVARAVSMYNFVFGHLESAHQSTRIEHVELRRRILERDVDGRMPFMSWPITMAFVKAGSFSDFIRSPVALDDRGFMSQTRQLQSGDGSLMVEMAVKLEDLRHRLPALQERLGLTLDLPHSHKTQFLALEANDVSARDRIYIRDIFSDDYVAFEYA
jgi:hypothetical protein